MGGQVFSLFSLSASGCTTDSHYPGDLLPPHTLRLSHTRKKKNTNTQALCSIWTHFTLCSLSSSYVGLFVAAVPELGEENREYKAREKRRMEKRGLRWWWWRRREGMNERERGKELMFTSHWECRLLLLAEHRLVSVCAPQFDLGVVPSCAWRQQYGDMAETLIRRA